MSTAASWPTSASSRSNSTTVYFEDGFRFTTGTVFCYLIWKSVSLSLPRSISRIYHEAHPGLAARWACPHSALPLPESSPSKTVAERRPSRKPCDKPASNRTVRLSPSVQDSLGNKSLFFLFAHNRPGNLAEASVPASQRHSPPHRRVPRFGNNVFFELPGSQKRHCCEQGCQLRIASLLLS